MTLRSISLVVLLGLAHPALAVEGSALDAAYQKEFSYLVAEKRVLQERLNAQAATAMTQLTASEAELEGLEGRSIRLNLDLERAETLLEGIDREVDGLDEAAGALASTLVAARTTLGRPNFDLGESPEDFSLTVQQLGRAFDEAAIRVGEGTGVQTEPGTFFLADGTEVSGQISRVGNVAAYGVSDVSAGVLVPAGEGRLRLWNTPADETARAVDAGKAPASASVYLFESVSRRIEEPPADGLAEKVRAGGIVGLVILGLGAIAMLLVLVRGLTLIRLGRGADALLHATAAAVQKGDHTRALQLTAGSGSMAAVLRSLIPALHQGREVIEQVAAEALLAQQPKLERFGTAITVIAAVAPLLGLLGTVTGMISTFDIITRFGTGDPKMLSGGISEALVTTQLGLVVAIPALLLGNLLTSWSTGTLDALERGALHLANLVEPALDAPQGSANSEASLASSAANV